ncbi:MAG: HPr family phosphocarrier protein [Oscillospiraceae bacterium]|jgi:phosphocarrier protein HPr|nr:HPr family phosphocarrier protein [Oscillospiraceae bacterium]
MESFFVQLASINDVKQFVNAATSLPCEVDVRAGRYLVNGKSIMGLLSIDLAEPVCIEVCGTAKQAEQLKAMVSSHVMEK